MEGPLFGMETELAFAAWRRSDGGDISLSGHLSRLFLLARERLVALPESVGPGMFLANGARFYLDMGAHPEICTPECQSPADVVRWQLACERILAGLVTELEVEAPDARIALFRCNVDYGESRATWGCHESYQHRSGHASLAPNLISHLVTRLIYTGAGGFDNKRRRLTFVISPRTSQLVHGTGGDTFERAIYNLRDEPLSRGGYQRLHVICGESLCSELSNYLKIGTTALVVRLVDANVCRGDRLSLRDEVKAMRQIARDPTLRRTVELRDGRRLTALQIQREYLEMVEEHLGAEFMPAWAPDVCRRWRCVLEQLEGGPETVATSLDWAIKYALFQQHVARREVSFSDLLRTRGLGAELCEIDVRFGELSTRSLFHALDEAGALAHDIPERGPIEGAMVEPPAGARAEARGRAIRELQGEDTRYYCSWDQIVDRRGRRTLDLGDPFATSAPWIPTLPPEDSLASPSRAGIAAGLDGYNEQNTQQALAAFEGAVASAERMGDRDQAALARFWCACAHHDAGRLEAADLVLAPALADDAGIRSTTRIRVLTRRALVQIERPAPLHEIESAVEAARVAWRLAGEREGHSRIAMLDARLLGVRGRFADAAAKAEEALLGAASDPICFCPSSHLRWLLTFLLRAERFRRVLLHLDRARDRFSRGELSRFVQVALSIAESNLALRLGRHREALERASAALDQSAAFTRHRARLSACIAYLEAAAAASALGATGPILEELHTWRDVEIGELRFEQLRAVALVQQAREGLPRRESRWRRIAGLEDRSAEPGDGPWGRLDETCRAARSVAEQLDTLLEFRYHLPALEAGLR